MRQAGGGISTESGRPRTGAFRRVEVVASGLQDRPFRPERPEGRLAKACGD
jgi:hypothetical protein